MTVKVYVVSFVRPVTVADVAGPTVTGVCAGGPDERCHDVARDRRATVVTQVPARSPSRSRRRRRRPRRSVLRHRGLHRDVHARRLRRRRADRRRARWPHPRRAPRSSPARRRQSRRRRSASPPSCAQAAPVRVNDHAAPWWLLSAAPPTSLCSRPRPAPRPTPNRPAPVSSLPVSFPPCCVQTPAERVNAQAAPRLPLSSEPPSRAVLPSAERGHGGAEPAGAGLVAAGQLPAFLRPDGTGARERPRRAAAAVVTRSRRRARCPRRPTAPRRRRTGRRRSRRCRSASRPAESSSRPSV